MVQTSFSDDGPVGTVAPDGGEPGLPAAGTFGVDVLARMSHQLRSPLAGITGLTRILLLRARSGRVDPGKLIEQLEMIQASARRSMVTVERLLEAARVEAAAATGFRLVDLGVLVAEAASAPVPGGEPPVAVVRADVPPQPVLVTTDPEMLSRLLREVIDNALTFAGATEVWVRLGTGSAPVMIEVSDDGAGIADRDQARIFEAFERGRGAAHHNPDGVGMGLYLARKIADRLGAELTLASHPDAGSTFTVAFGQAGGLPAPAPGAGWQCGC